ncbi:SDR family NAD(P)-dependent oxidoreductase [Thermospira aquatica]|uniref:SDR family NAD(P)-dependent oxidoreductase n=1 Tax=Thermospira aquatica TaxID=2828656 RepID=A0AAX3BAS7_9SPIR|nr:SDR family NAD(P)-dependent oxidoreductase [Thermospira aquatica]URA09374.1 SDR family NAD(P)-dependent oxidoreductase [Thermospira aquatica]
MKYVVITGVSRGLGKSLAKAFLFSGWGVIGISRTSDGGLEEEAKKMGKSYVFVPWDLTELETLESLAEKMVSLVPGDSEEVVLVHNAGEMQPVTEIKNLSYKEVEHNFILNTVSVIVLTAAFLRKVGGRFPFLQLVFISSRSVISPRRLWAVYGAAKAGVDHFVSSLALEYKGKDNMRAIAIHPPAMDTEMRKNYLKRRSFLFWLWDWIERYVLRQKKVYDPDLVAWKLFYLIEKHSLPSGSVWRWE